MTNVDTWTKSFIQFICQINVSKLLVLDRNPWYKTQMKKALKLLKKCKYKFIQFCKPYGINKVSKVGDL